MTLGSKAVRFLRSEEGATSVEYAVLLMLILGAVITAMQLSGGIGDSLDDSSNSIGGATQGGGGDTSSGYR